jgi:hypothetical protein
VACAASERVCITDTPMKIVTLPRENNPPRPRGVEGLVAGLNGPDDMELD